MERLGLFAKGNPDVRDTLHALKLGGEVKWNGINELLRNPPALARVRHETPPRSNLPLAASDQPLETQLELEAQALARMAGTSDAREGLTAFHEKRRPSFSGQ